MLHVLFILLKILGILLLLLVSLFLLVLLVPIRYSFDLEKEEKISPKFVVKVTWLFWLIYFKVSYIDDALDYRIRILGHQVVGNQSEFLTRQKKRQEKKEEKKKKKATREMPVAATEKNVPLEKEAEEDFLKLNVSSEEKNKINSVISSKKSSDRLEVKNKQDKKECPKKKNKSVLKNIKKRINTIKETKTNLDKLPWRDWLVLGKDVLKRFLKHILPQKLQGTVEFGLDDPAYTGYITGLVATFYSKYGEHFSLYPNFERKMFAAQCSGRGRIRLGYILVLFISILKEKNVRTMIKNIILD